MRLAFRPETGNGRLAVFLAGAVCGALLAWAAIPLGRRFEAWRWKGGYSGSAALEADREAARSAVGRIQDLLGEILGMIEPRADRVPRSGGGAG